MLCASRKQRGKIKKCISTVVTSLEESWVPARIKKKYYLILYIINAVVCDFVLSLLILRFDTVADRNEILNYEHRCQHVT